MFATLAQKITKNSLGRKLLLGVALYMLIGILYMVVSVYCYNVRNWDVYGGFSLPPLFFPLGIFFDLLLWPVYLWADFINSVGIFGTCRPMP
ncbi:MAG: hypothetical protein Q7U34_15795 [Anaerolineales bacterium]|nr:hypothetical protein [Anaerolineales bacterium]